MKSVGVVHVLKYPNGNYVALDTPSGGYPTPVNANQAHNFQSEEKATQYQEIFSNMQFVYTVLEIFDHELS